MGNIRVGFLLWLSLVCVTAQVAAQALDGKYTAIGSVPARKSLDVVVVEEFVNFTCPHCNSFRLDAKPVFQKHGKRLKQVRMPILFRGQADAPLRLFFVAQAQGKEEAVEAALFDAAFKFNVNIYDTAVVNYLARTNGLAEAYQRDGQAEWVTRKIAISHARASELGVEATPTLVVQSTLRLTPETSMEVFVANFDRIVGQLLK